MFRAKGLDESSHRHRHLLVHHYIGLNTTSSRFHQFLQARRLQARTATPHRDRSSPQWRTRSTCRPSGNYLGRVQQLVGRSIKWSNSRYADKWTSTALTSDYSSHSSAAPSQWASFRGRRWWRSCVPLRRPSTLLYVERCRWRLSSTTKSSRKYFNNETRHFCITFLY